MEFLPVSKEDMKKRGWDQLDFVYISGDAYVDHPSFGHAVICRTLEKYGYKVGIIAQPDFRSAEDFKRLGKPRLGFLVSAGNVDSMVNHYSVFKKRRKTDYYTPGGVAGKRPDRACIVYTSRAKEAYKDVPVILGGIEASLRRLAHYDYWDNKLRRSILLDSKADIISYGMGERSIIEIAEALDSGLEARDITWIRGTVVRKKFIDDEDTVILPSFEEMKEDKLRFAESFRIQYRNNEAPDAVPLAEQYDKNLYVVQNPPQPVLSREELDEVYAMPFTREYHPMYEKEGGVPALKEVKFSLTSVRGCFGGCAFCALTYHQGRIVQSRSIESIVAEAEELVKKPDFKGYINDVGGPTANFRRPSCKKQLEKGTCKNRDCLHPVPCKNLDADHKEYIELLNRVKSIKGVKKVFVRSGVRFDYALADKNDDFIKQLCRYHVSGTLKVAPEHVSDHVLRLMRKPSNEVFQKFVKKYNDINKKYDMDQYMIPYFISSHPGSRLEDAVKLAEYLNKNRFVPDQVQDFYPTPGTLSTCMYYTGVDPLTGEKVYIPDSMEEKKMQRALLHFNKPENYDLVYKALQKTKRTDLIGFGPDKLIKPRSFEKKDNVTRPANGRKGTQKKDRRR
ncbi:MAG: YgiQ family radical SAM protein [Clostridiales bacterium]|nr:YgiQ family radical SAM protein [Clostridiales bacterium]